MKKYVLSAVVTSLLVPWAYAMDGGAAPAVEVEVEVPAVETPAVEEVAVDVGEVAPVDVTTLELEVGVEVPKPEVDPGDPVLLGLPEVIEVDPAVDCPVATDHVPDLWLRRDVAVEVDPLPLPVEGETLELNPVDLAIDSGHSHEGETETCEFPHVIFEDGPVHTPFDGGVDENGHQVWIVSNPPVDENGNGIAYALGGEIVEPSEGEAVDPNLVDLASQSGLAVDGNDKSVETEVIDLSFQGEGSNEVDADGNPVIYYFATASTGELPQNAPAGGSGEVEETAVEPTAIEDSPVRSLSGDIQPNFRGGITDRGAEALAASSVGALANPEAPAETQLLNDEQRGAVRGLRSDEEPVKPRSGMSKLLSKFRKPKSEVTLASATTTTDKALSSKLAEVDRMRDTALRTGDQKMLAKADKLEKELRAKSGKVTKIPTRTK